MTDLQCGDTLKPMPKISGRIIVWNSGFLFCYLWVSSAVNGSCCTLLYNCYWTGLSVNEQIPANNPNQQTNKQNLDVNNSCTTSKTGQTCERLALDKPGGWSESTLILTNEISSKLHDIAIRGPAMWSCFAWGLRENNGNGLARWVLLASKNVKKQTPLKIEN